MPFTLEQLQALEDAMATGAKTVKYGDKETEFRSLADMHALRDQMRDELGITDPAAKRRLISYNKGIYPDDDKSR
jgi:hypothetical protein